MILITGTVRLHADKLEEGRPHRRRVMEATREEDGCLAYDIGEGLLDLTLYEIASSRPL